MLDIREREPRQLAGREPAVRAAPRPPSAGRSASRAYQYRYILLAMAKVMISLPEELVGRIDEQARRRGTTRSGLLRELAERELASDVEVRQQGVRELLAAATAHGGNNARHVREQRRAR